MLLRLPVSGLLLKYKNKHRRELVDELAAHDRTLDDLWKDPFLSAVRLVQVGRAWEQRISLDEAEAIVDQEQEGGVLFNDLTSGMARAFYGHRVRPITIAPEPPEDDAEAPDDGTAPKKSDRLDGIPLGRVS